MNTAAKFVGLFVQLLWERTAPLNYYSIEEMTHDVTTKRTAQTINNLHSISTLVLPTQQNFGICFKM